MFANASDTALLIGAAGGFLVAAATAATQIITALSARKDKKEVLQAIEATHEEVRTYNALTMGQKSDADESRRIEDIPEADRTAAEREHVAEIPPAE